MTRYRKRLIVSIVLSILVAILTISVSRKGYLLIWLTFNNSKMSKILEDAKAADISWKESSIEVRRGNRWEQQSLVLDGRVVFEGFDIGRITSSQSNRVAFTAYLDGHGGPGLQMSDNLFPSSLWVVNEDGDIQRVTDNRYHAIHATISPDGARIAFSGRKIGPEDDGQWSTFIYDVNSGRLRKGPSVSRYNEGLCFPIRWYGNSVLCVYLAPNQYDNTFERVEYLWVK